MQNQQRKQEKIVTALSRQPSKSLSYQGLFRVFAFPIVLFNRGVTGYPLNKEEESRVDEIFALTSQKFPDPKSQDIINQAKDNVAFYFSPDKNFYDGSDNRAITKILKNNALTADDFWTQGRMCGAEETPEFKIEDKPIMTNAISLGQKYKEKYNLEAADEMFRQMRLTTDEQQLFLAKVADKMCDTVNRILPNPNDLSDKDEIRRAVDGKIKYMHNLLNKDKILNADGDLLREFHYSVIKFTDSVVNLQQSEDYINAINGKYISWDDAKENDACISDLIERLHDKVSMLSLGHTTDLISRIDNQMHFSFKQMKDENTSKELQDKLYSITQDFIDANLTMQDKIDASRERSDSQQALKELSQSTHQNIYNTIYSDNEELTKAYVEYEDCVKNAIIEDLPRENCNMQREEIKRQRQRNGKKDGPSC